jgi:hypothetical protein
LGQPSETMPTLGMVLVIASVIRVVIAPWRDRGKVGGGFP